MADTCPVYRPRKPHLTPFYQCVQDHFDSFERVYEERFAKRCGFWRPYLKEVIYRYLECGDLHRGFARLVCQTCGRNFFLAFSCKRRYFCPSCHQKRVVEFGEWLCQHVLKAVPYRHFVFSIPKILRRFFLHDRKLLAALSRCAWESLRTFLRAAVPEPHATPGAIVATQTFGDWPERYHPHLHVLATDGAFYGHGMFRVAPRFNLKDLENLFRHSVLSMLLRKGKITREFICMMEGWRRSGFNVYCGERIYPYQKGSLERLAAYLIRASFSQERMEYMPEEAAVVYHSKDGKEQKTYDALEWIAAMGTHVPLRGEQMVRYYGEFSNRVRGRRRKAHQIGDIPTILEPEISSAAARKNWARLIQKVYEANPLVCSHCQGPLTVVSFIEDGETIRKILEHLGLWLANTRPQPKAHSPPHLYIDNADSQLPSYEEDFSQITQWDADL
jgi:hypothetical protein